ncbi:Phospholipid-transporting ATPase 2 [Morella rubra]|uniref:Phospholipid-transporting ATPase 2 n=1 Tax=Morella rubra TaxID=262757 RepID=A0A6A1VB36_9ROSI|nr:Phospholipid-transporting ATPase 2 [Morella rubra]
MVQAQDIHVGNIVWIRENDEVPCDLVLLGTSDPQGVCYIETAALDGEIDLKTRIIPSACMGGVIECPSPDKDIRRFDANLRLFPPFLDNDLCPLTIKNTILQSCYLRNTEWACGVAVYTGNETKLGMSRGIPEPKLTAVDAMIDKLTGAIFVFQIVVVIVLGIAGNIWKDTEARKVVATKLPFLICGQWYVQYPQEGPWFELLIIPLRFELLCSIMIPISIKVSLDLVKSLYAKFIDWDDEMIDTESGTPSHATNTAISEDLGQVEYILTDKTGTLTENKMIFRRCCINGAFYGNESGNALKDVELLNAVSSGSPDLALFLTVMAICNTVIPVQSKSGDILYKSQSQDEDALVRAAAELQMVFASKNGNVLEIKCNSSIIQHEVLETLEFTSDRKRMSVVVKDCQNGKILLLSKGADEAILPYACAGQQTRMFIEAVEQYTQLGLRTLCLACRELKEDEYREWSLLFKEASSTLVDREWRIAEVCQRLEHNLEILGVTAIEDRLQDGVPETIKTLRKAGINFWMLTGDKQNTAIQIALSSNFISPEPKGQLLSIDGKTEDEVHRSLERVLLTMRITMSEPKDVAFVVDGWALEIALKYYRKAFTELAILSRTAICCRVTPSQKAQLVELLKSCDYRTLAIGDGGNDVRMIQQADIGVGISGREGLQAARAADYSIGSVSGTSLFNSVSLMAYNVFYTSIPVLVSVLDKDLSEETVMQHPQILFYCQAGRLLNPSTFAGWFGRSLFHVSVIYTFDILVSQISISTRRVPKAIVVFVISINSYAYEKSEMEEVSLVALSGCIWLQAFVVMLETKSVFKIIPIFTIVTDVDAFNTPRHPLYADFISSLERCKRLPMEGPRYMTQFLVAVERDVRERCKRGGVNEKEMWEMCKRGLAVYAVSLKGVSLVREIDVVFYNAAVHEEPTNPHGNFAADIQPIKDFLRSHLGSSFRWTPREGNNMAHLAPKRAANNSDFGVLHLIVAAGMGPILALKYFRYTYRPSKINTLQQAERLGGPILSLGSIEPQPRSLEKDVSPLSITQPKNRNPVYEPLLSDSPNTRRSAGSGTTFDFFQSQSRLSSSYSRNCKDN